MLRLPTVTIFCMLVMNFWTAPLLMAKTVNCDAPGQTLQKAIDGAEIGSEITVSGTCNDGPFFVKKSLTLRGPATLKAPSGGFAVLSVLGGTAILNSLNIDATNNNEIGIIVQGATARISGFRIENATNEGMRLIGGAHANVSGSTFENNANGVIITIASTAIFFDSIFQDNSGFGLRISQGSSGGLITAPNQNILQRNLIGIGVDTGAAFQMQDADIRTNDSVGVSVTHDAFVTMFDPPSTIESNGTDVVCDKRGGFQIFSPQISTSEETSISSDCLVDGTIF